MASLHTTAGLFLFFLSVLIAREVTGFSKDCGPCAVEDCPPVPKGCFSDAVLDNCGCCLICPKVSTRRFYPFLTRRYMNYKNVPNLRVFGSRPALSFSENNDLDYHNDEFSWQRWSPMSSRTTYAEKRKSGPIIIHITGTGNPFFSFLRTILKQYVDKTNTTPTPKRNCGFYRKLSLYPIKPVFGQVNRYHNYNTFHRKQNNDNQNGIVRVTRLRFLPIRMLWLRKIRRPHEDLPFGVDHLSAPFGHSPVVHVITMRTLNPNRHLIPYRRSYWQKKYDDDHRVSHEHALKNRVHKLLSSVLGLMVKTHMQNRAMHSGNENIVNHVKRQNNGGTEGNIYPYNHYNVFDREYSPFEPQYLNRNYENKMIQKHAGSFVDTPEFGKKQIDENIVDLRDHVSGYNKYNYYKYPQAYNDEYNEEEEKTVTFRQVNYKVNRPKTLLAKLIEKIKARRKNLMKKLSQTKLFYSQFGNSDNLDDMDVMDVDKYHFKRSKNFRNFIPRYPYFNSGSMNKYPLGDIEDPFSSFNFPLSRFHRTDDSASEIEMQIRKRYIAKRVQQLAQDANRKAREMMKHVTKNPTKTLLKVMNMLRRYVRRIQLVSGKKPSVK